MIPVSNEYRRQLIAGNRNWLIKVDMTLADGTILNLTNEHIWDNGIVLDEAISSDDTFDIGAAIVGSLKVVINNINGNFSLYDFYDAKLVLWLGVTGDVDENDVQRYYRIGFYVVDTPTYNGSLITLNCLDNMTWFDVPFEEVTGITYPTTAGNLVNDICSHVGVFLANPSFPNYTTDIEAAPDQKLNCREVIQYVAQMCCCYCKIDRAGELYLWWYDKNAIIGRTDYDGGSFSTTTTPYSDGCDLDGGHFNPWDGDNADGGTFQDLLNGAWISSNFQIEVSTDDVVVTGVRLRNSTSKDDSYDELWVDPVVEQDHDRYVLVVENNPFINKDNAAALANIIGSTLAGLPIRGYTATSLADFSYETGDMAIVIDFRGNRYYTWITHFTFTTNNSENFSCGVESLRKRSEERFSGTVKTLAEANENASAILSDYDKAQGAMNELAQSALGYYKYEHTVTGGGLVTWLHNGATEVTTDPENPRFPNSTSIIKISGDGVFISDGSIDPQTGEYIYTQGYDSNSGTAILNLIYAHGITADFIKTTSLSEITANMGTLTAGSITGGTITGTTSITSYYNNSTSNGYTQISGGNCYVYADENNYFRVRAMGVSGTREVTLGPHISVRDTDQGFFSERSLRYLGWAVEDAYAAHSSDKKLKKKIKDIPVKKSRDLILGARPRYYEFKKSLEGGVRSGFVAQELRENLDNIGDKSAIERESIRREGEREVIYEDFIAHLVNTTKDLYKQIDELKTELADLKARVK